MERKRRRSPRRHSTTKEDSPPPKRKKLQRKPTPELEEIENKSIVERKTSSFLQSVKNNEAMSSLSSQNRKKLLRRVSSLMNPDSSELELDPVNLIQKEGFHEEVFFPPDCGHITTLTVDLLLEIFSYLQDIDRWRFALSCKRLFYLFNNFTSAKYLSVYWGEKAFSETLKPFIVREATVARQKVIHLVRRKGDIYVEARKLEKQFENGNLDPSTLFDNLNVPREKMDYGWEQSSWHGVLAPERPSCQPKGLSVSLYEYQALGLSWLLSIERIIKNKQKFIFSSLVHIPGFSNLAYDGKKPIIVTQESLHEEKHKLSFTAQGGMFCDEMGLGKTISMIALILSNPRVQINDEFVPCPTPKTMFNNEDPSYPPFDSFATLVVCPPQLVTQWGKEIQTHSNLVCYTVATVAQHKKISYEDVISADVIVVSLKLLQENDSYKSLCARRDGTGAWTEYGSSQIDIYSAQPCFHHIAWHRIILDEGHEHFRKYFRYDSFVSNFRWYVTGTPLPNGSLSLTNVFHFLNCSGDIRENNMDRAFKRSLFWRNMKESVDTQVEIPPVFEEVEIVHLTPIEQSIYDALRLEPNSETMQRKFLSEPSMYNRFGRIDDPTVPGRAIITLNSSIQTTKKELKKVINTKQQQRAQLSRRDTPKQDKQRLRYEIERNEEYIQKLEERIVRYVSQSACFSRLLVDEGTADQCEACMEFLPGRTKLGCGHNVCPPCFEKIYKSEHYQCPTCNEAVEFTNIALSKNVNFAISDVQITINEVDDEWVSKLRTKYGSKFAATAKYLFNIMKFKDDVKMIVFSQYESALFQLSTVLESVDPQTFKNKMVMCKGNVHARKKQLESFTSTDADSARILLLSLKHSASGTHLAAATHVLLLDPVVGTAGEARATDAQAIARAHRLGQGELVTAIRFIVVRTIDQDDYENAYGAIVVPRGLGPKSARK